MAGITISKSISFDSIDQKNKAVNRINAKGGYINPKTKRNILADTPKGVVVKRVRPEFGAR